MTSREALDFFRSLSPSTIKLGLGRMAAALEELGHPERRLRRTLHVAGTNGKGSTCAFADSVLRTAGLRVGLYTSPHLIRLNERFRLNGEEISDEVLGRRILEILERSATARSELTYFELGTLIAFWHFAEEDVDVAVLETGLGGRLDATNLCVPTVTAITALGLDHTELLGNTLEAIAFEKAGIFKLGAPAVTAPQAPEAMAVLEKRAAEIGVSLTRVDVEASVGERQLGLRGPHQRENAAVAMAALARLGVALSPEVIDAGLAQARWPGRLEELRQNPTIVVDGAHNVHGVQSLLRALDALYPGRGVRLVFGVFADKSYEAMFGLLFPRVECVYATALPSPRALDPRMVVEWCRKRGDSHASRGSPHGSVESALKEALGDCTGDEIVLCAGSLILVGEVEAAARRGFVFDQPAGR